MKLNWQARAFVLVALHAMVVPGLARAQSASNAPPPASAGSVPASAPAPEPTPARAPGSRLWIVAGGGYSVARAGCATCSTEGVFHHSSSLLIDAGVRVNPKVDAGIEMYWVRTKVETEDPILTTFVLAVTQLRPWHTHGFFMRVGMGVGFIGKGIWNPLLKDALKEPYTTNALGVMYGTGWIFTPNRRLAVQIHGTHHVAAIGELTTVSETTIKNVVGNYWTVGAVIVIR